MTKRLIIEVAPVDRQAEAVVRLCLPAPLVLGLPPGGMLAALRVARALQAPLDMLLPCHAGALAGAGCGIAWPALAGRSVVIVDDGGADPLDWHAALALLRPLRPDCLAIVVPEFSPAIERALSNEYEHLFGRRPPWAVARPALPAVAQAGAARPPACRPCATARYRASSRW